MARQPDIQYIQMYNYGSTARKLKPSPQVWKEKYQLPEQMLRKAQARQSVLDPLSVCAIAVACVMLVAMLIGMLKIGELTGRRRELQAYVAVLQEQRAELQKTYEESYDLQQVELRARELGLVSADEVDHVQMGPLNPEAQDEHGFFDRMGMLFDELFAKAPR